MIVTTFQTLCSERRFQEAFALIDPEAGKPLRSILKQPKKHQQILKEATY